MAQDPIIALENVTVDFDGFLALRGLDFSMERGELRFVIGPNGAGKTSLLDVITGRVRPVEGRVLFDGNYDLLGRRPHEIAHLGIGRKFQTPSVFPEHTVLENLALARRSGRGVFHTLTAGRRHSHHDLREVLDLVGLDGHRNEPAGFLSHGQKQWLEIAMLLSQEPELLLLDEPAAGMTGHERELTVELLEKIAARRSLLVIEHDMEFVRRLARTVTVLHAGSTLCQGTMTEVQANPVVLDVYLGRTQSFPEPAVEIA